MDFLEDLKRHANIQDAAVLSRFHGCKKGAYAGDDIFIGIRVPVIRRVLSKHSPLSLKMITRLVQDKAHEIRLGGWLGLADLYRKSVAGHDEETRKKCAHYYLRNSTRVNGWDLVDLSAPAISGHWFTDHDRRPLYDLADHGNLWQKRISIVSTWTFIKEGDLDDTFRLAKRLFFEKHHLLHKASGWMLREAGKKDYGILKSYLKKHYLKIPRTTLRYAVEKFPEPERKAILMGKFLI